MRGSREPVITPLESSEKTCGEMIEIWSAWARKLCVLASPREYQRASRVCGDGCRGTQPRNRSRAGTAAELNLIHSICVAGWRGANCRPAQPGWRCSRSRTDLGTVIWPSDVTIDSAMLPPILVAERE